METLILTKDEMLALWKQRHYLEPLRADCQVSRSDALDVDARCLQDMRAWYLNLLQHGPDDWLASEDVGQQCQIVVSPDGVAEIELPENVVRVLWVRMPLWRQECRVETDAQSVKALLQGNPFSRGGIDNPAAVCLPGSRVLRIYSPMLRAGSAVDHIEAVVDTGPDCYRLHPAVIPHIGESLTAFTEEN